eukprot:gene8757-33620_t
MNLRKLAKPVTVAKPAWHSRAFPPPNRMCTAPRNLATPVGKSPEPNTACNKSRRRLLPCRSKNIGAGHKERDRSLEDISPGSGAEQEAGGREYQGTHCDLGTEHEAGGREYQGTRNDLGTEQNAACD